MKKSIQIKQRDITDCGAACIASVAAFHNLELPVSRIRQLASTDKKGTNVLGIIEAANKLGFDAKGVRGNFDSLFKIPKPSIAHIIVKEVLQHYVVVYKTTSKYIEVEATVSYDGRSDIKWLHPHLIIRRILFKKVTQRFKK